MVNVLSRLCLVCFFAVAFGCATERSAETPTAGAVWHPEWVEQTTGTTARFQAISAVDKNVVWASGTEGTFARTLDGGASWEVAVVPDADTLQFRDVHGVNAETAYLLSAGTGTTSRIYKTNDGGQAWAHVFTNPDPSGFFDCMDFWDAERGLLYGDSVDEAVVMFATADGGVTWERVAGLPPALSNEGGFAASGTCVITKPGGYAWVGTGASGEAARVFRTTDYGQTWDVVTTPLSSDSGTSGIFSLAFFDAENGVALGGDYSRADEPSAQVAITNDGGVTWQLAGQPIMNGTAYGGTVVPGAPTPTIVAVSPNGSEYSVDNGQTWTRIDTVDYWATTFISPTVGWAVGPDGRIVKAQFAE